eukprot:scaffold14557_cov133-Skeletonema_menzelii.AAC.2
MRRTVIHQRVFNLASLLVALNANVSGFAFTGMPATVATHEHRSVIRQPTLVHTTNSDGENDSIDDDGEEDIITAKLRRNSEKPLIDAMKEHDKMVEENKIEAGVNGSNNSTAALSGASNLYSYMLANVVHPDFDPDESHEEAYLNEQFKELLSRKGDDLTQMGPGIATLPLDPSSEEAKVEANLAAKETDLQRIVDEVKEKATSEWDESNLEDTHQKQTEAMERARQLQAEIDQLHIDDCGAVLLANLEFYEAFSSRDAEWMKNVWWQSPSVICIHPSHSPLIGSNTIVDSFSKIFENGIKNTSRIRGGTSTAGSFMTPTNIRGLSVRGTTASLVCDEEVYAKGSLGESERDRALVNKLVTTNIFRKIGGKWKMVHRHASWHPETAAARDAMKAEPGIILYDEEKDLKDTSGGTSKQGMTLRKVNSQGSTSKRPVKSSSIPQSLDGLDANAVLGIPMPKEEPKKSTPKSDEGVMGKIINLSDLLGGGESNTDDGDDAEKGLGDVLADLFGDSAESDSTTISGTGTPDDPFIKRRVIKIGPDGIENLTGAKNDGAKSDVGDTEKNVTIDLRGKSEEERKRVLSQLVDGVLNDALPEFDSSGEEVVENDPIDVSVTSTDDKENLRQRCISTLRKLSENGMISGKQKRVLLTDIITSSARGETSLIETAYELLCTGDDVVEEGTEGMEDFSEQCRVFAEVERDY